MADLISPYARSNPTDSPGASLTISPARRQEMLKRVQHDNGGMLSNLLYALDTPGAQVRGLLAGKNGWNDERVSGRDLLRQHGLVGQENNWGNFFGGVAAEIATDPLSYLSGPIKALTGGGRAAHAAGLLDQAPATLSKQFLAGQASPEIAKRAAAGVAKIGRDVSATDVLGRPLIGQRAAQRHGTLDDLVTHASDPTTARADVMNYLRGDEAAYSRIAKQKLGGNFGVGLPFMDPSFSFNVPGGGMVGDAMDKAAGALRWSPVGRAYNAFTNNAVGGALDAETQMIAAGADSAKRTAEAVARREHTLRTARLHGEEPDVFSEEGNRAIGRLIEKPIDNPSRETDLVWDSQHPAAREYMDWWKQESAASPKKMADVGLQGTEFKDPHIEGYLPRKTDGLLDKAGVSSPSLGRVLKTITSDQMHRADELMVPGGRDTIAFKLSRDPYVAGTKRDAKTDDKAAKHIAQILYGDSAANGKQALHLAQLLHKLPDHIIKDVPLFAQHPSEMIGRYLEGRAGAESVQKSLFDSLAHIAATQQANLVEGGRHITMNEALARLQAKSTVGEAGEIGARQQMRTRLAARTGGEADKIDLAMYSIPEDHVNRLLRARDVYDKPEAAKLLGETLDQINAHWKSGVLSNPARINRDLYSGAYSNWLEGALTPAAWVAAKNLNTDAALPGFQKYLQSIPRYGNVADPEERMAQFYADLNATGMNRTTVDLDRRNIVSGASATAPFIGSTRDTFGGALRELGPTSGRSWKQFGSDFLDINKNPIARAGARAGNLSDKINRMTGYLSLMKQGVAPAEAARRMARAHVDYSSLTQYERHIRDTFLPFYAYTSRIFREVLRQLAERPGGRYGQGLRTYERLQEGNDETYTPSRMRQQFAAPISQSDPVFGGLAAGVDPKNATRYFTDVDLPGFDQLQMFTGSPGNIAKNAGQMLNPFLRTGAELITGEDFSTGARLNAASRGSGPVSKLYRAATGDPEAGRGGLTGTMTLDKLAGVTPYADRPLRILAGLADIDTGLSPLTRGVSVGWSQTGLGKLRDVSADDIRRDAIRRLEEQASGYTQDIAVPYIPADQVSNVPLDAREALALARQLQKERKAIRKREALPVSPFDQTIAGGRRPGT